MEGYLFSAFFIFHFFRYGEIPLQTSKRLAGLYFFLTLPWIVYTIINSWDQESFVSTHLQILSLLFTLGVFLTFYLMEKNSYFSNIMCQITPLKILAVFTMLLIVFIIFKPDHMIWNLKALILNLFDKPGKWIPFWEIITPIVIFFIIKNRIWKSLKFDVLLLAFFMNAYALTFLLSFFRQPLRVEMSDSINRMLIHFTPILLVWLFYMISSLFERKGYLDNINEVKPLTSPQDHQNLRI